MSEVEAYHELCAYSLTHSDPAFIHQHVVDSFAAQNANEQTKPITLTFALLGLYLHVEKQFTGKEVQRAHQHLARTKRTRPSFSLPHERGAVTAAQVLAATPGAERDNLIHTWCAAVWEPFRGERNTVQIIESLCAELPRFSRGNG